MSAIASQITSLTIVCSTVYSGADPRKHQSSASLAFVWGNHRDRWIPHTKGQLRGKYFHLMTSSWLLNSTHKSWKNLQERDINDRQCDNNVWECRWIIKNMLTQTTNLGGMYGGFQGYTPMRLGLLFSGCREEDKSMLSQLACSAHEHFDALVQERNIFIVNALEILHSCTKLSICSILTKASISATIYLSNYEILE